MPPGERKSGIPDSVEMPAPVMGAEDFSYLLQKRQGAFAFLGVCPSDQKPTDAHACRSRQACGDAEAGEPHLSVRAVRNDMGGLQVLMDEAAPVELAQGDGDADRQA